MEEGRGTLGAHSKYGRSVLDKMPPDSTVAVQRAVGLLAMGRCPGEEPFTSSASVLRATSYITTVSLDSKSWPSKVVQIAYLGLLDLGRMLPSRFSLKSGRRDGNLHDTPAQMLLIGCFAHLAISCRCRGGGAVKGHTACLLEPE